MRWRWFILFSLLLLLTALLLLPLVGSARDDVAFCLSCHVMADSGQSHATSYHWERDGTTCSDCHTASLLQKYTDGARHVAANLTGIHPMPITLRESSREVVASQCAQCHQATSLHTRTKRDKGEDCLECHRGHDPRAVKLPGQN